ncbi:MAG: transglycosylase SLT domain-containing protein [Alphaproteobacteria bacterium]|nr:transglycosylase SLT domain-containing protein [Alphaproteobacteria bacterium]
MSIGPFRTAGQIDPAPRGVSREVFDAIRDASQKSGVDFKYMLAKAQTESSFDPRAKARTSSASGLYQFIESTWLNTVRQHGAKYGLAQAAAQIEDDDFGNPRVRDPAMRRSILDLRFDPKTASAMAAEFAKSNHEQLESALGSGINSTDLYLAHFLGANGATRFLASYRQDPQRIAAAQFPEAAAANRGVFYDPQSGRARTLAQVYDFFSRKMTGEIAAVDQTTTDELPAAPQMSPRRAVELPPQLQMLANQFGLKGASLKPETIMAMALLAEPLVGSLRGGNSLFGDSGRTSRIGAGKVFNPDIGT